MLTTVSCQEEGSVDAVVDERGLAVQQCSRVHSPVDGVDIQPACRILVNGIPEKKNPQTMTDCIQNRFKKCSQSAGHKLPC